MFSGIAFVLCVLLTVLVMFVCKKYSLYDSVSARKIHSGKIPRLGGVAFAVSFFICTIICFKIDKGLLIKNMWPLIASGTLIFVFGIIDDLIEMRAIFKLLVQLAATLILVLNGFKIRRIFSWQLPDYISYCLTFFWILGIINAFNLIDGLDGLCGTLSLCALVIYGILFINNKYEEGAAICFILSASLVGFLCFNWPPAKIFMGDGGRQFLGFMIATIPLYSINAENLEYNKFIIQLLVVAIPMLDTIAAIWRRIRDHRPIMSPDRLHLHHKLLNIGFTKTHTLYLLLGIQIFICTNIFLASRIMSKRQAALLLFLIYIFIIAFFCVIHYTNRAVLRRITLENQLRNKEKIPDYYEETRQTPSQPKVSAVVLEDDDE